MMSTASQRLQLSMFQLAKIVFACGVATAMISPAFRTTFRYGLPFLPELFVAASVIVFLTWVLLSYILVRPGRTRTTLIDFLLLGAVTSSLGYILWLSGPLVRLALHTRLPYTFPVSVFVPHSTFVIGSIGIPVLGTIFLTLVLRLVHRGRSTGLVG